MHAPVIFKTETPPMKPAKADKKTSASPADYRRLLADIKERVRNAQLAVLRSVNKELVVLYWDIGRMIVQRQTGKTWGKAVVQRLAGDLQKEFPGVAGFSAQNLWYMRQFHVEYCDSAKLQPLVGKISWTKNIVILSHCKDPLEREFYLRMTRKFGWSKNVLIHQIENQSYEKTLLNQTNFGATLASEAGREANLAVKDDYLFDFLELGEKHSERELEKALLSRMEDFLRGMGGLLSGWSSPSRGQTANTA
jgi:predicted nuclease of restriction endonuclease-like (RecB) superfamily